MFDITGACHATTLHSHKHSQQDFPVIYSMFSAENGAGSCKKVFKWQEGGELTDDKRRAQAGQLTRYQKVSAKIQTIV